MLLEPIESGGEAENAPEDSSGPTQTPSAQYEGHVVPGEAVLHGSNGERTEPTIYLWLSDADGLRTSKLEHSVQGTDGDRNLSRTTPVSPRAQRVTDHPFEATD